MESPFTSIDNSIDIINAFLFLYVVYLSFHFIMKNHIVTRGKVMYGFIIFIATGHVFQTISQVLSNYFPSFRIWDLINYVTAVFLIAVAHRIQKTSKHNHETCNPT